MAAEEARTLSDAAAAKKILFHLGSDKVSVLQGARMSSSITLVVIKGVTKAVVMDLTTYMSPGSW
jgi:hypothetical protein